MGKHAQLVIGPAGSGKSTYCSVIQRHCQVRKRTVHVINLDPAAEAFQYSVAIDIRDLISVTDIMDELSYGPNGSLVFALEYLSQHLSWLAARLQDYSDDYVLIDCPGQIELFTHLPFVKLLVAFLQREGYAVCAVYCLDAMFVQDHARFVAGIMMCLSAMVHLEVPHISLLTKCDQLQDKSALEEFCQPSFAHLLWEQEQQQEALSLQAPMQSYEQPLLSPASSDTQHNSLSSSSSSSSAAPSLSSRQQPRRWHRLNQAIALLIEEYSMVSFVPFDVSDEESIELALMQIDHAIQYGEDVEPTEPKDEVEIDEGMSEGLSFG